MAWRHAMRSAWACLAAAALAAGAAYAADAPMAPGDVPAGEPPIAAAPAQGMIELNFPENVELKVLADYVGKRLGINFIYDEQILQKRITIKATQQIPADSLLTLLQSALRMKAMRMTPGPAGLMHIQPAGALTADSLGPRAGEQALQDAGPAAAVTRVFSLRHTSSERAAEVIVPFLSSASANLTPLPEHRLVIVTDYLDNMAKIEQMVSVIDQPGVDVRIQFVEIMHVEAEALAQKVKQMLDGKAQARGGRAAAKGAAPGSGAINLVADARTNQIAVVGPAELLSEAIELIRTLDVPLNTRTRVYTFSVVGPDRVDELVKKLIGELAAKRLYRSATDTNAGLLIATTTPEIHEQIESLKTSLDKPIVEAQSPIRFYKLQNAKAQEVLETLRAIEGESGLGAVSIDGLGAGPASPGMPLGALPPGTPPVDPLAIRGPSEDQINAGAAGNIVEGRGREGGPPVVLRDARIMADEASNTIIVIARPSMQLIYEKLIERLDVRRPQVLVEATVVAIDTSDGFALGVEFSTSDDVDGGTMLNFTSFGLRQVDPTTGELVVRPGVGFNSVLLSADIADIVLRALETDRRAKVVSRPSVLINDNATGVLLSESEEPYASVNASNTVATTSLGGFVSAGTKIEITPQIAEGDYLKLEYEITLSSFGEDVSEELPPSRQKNSIASEATIPNGHTIVVGGLTRDNIAEAVDRVPILGKIPYIEYLFSNRTKDVQKLTLFVFIRAVILRDDKFADLKSISGQAVNSAHLPDGMPESEPVVIP